MVTLKQLYQQFGNDPAWQRLAAASLQPMVSVYLRRLGDKDVTTVTAFDLELQAAMSQQPDERKAKARSCMQHLIAWAKKNGHPCPQDAVEEPIPAEKQAEEQPKPRKTSLPKPKQQAQAKPHDGCSRRRPEKKVAIDRPEQADSVEDYLDPNIYDSEQTVGRPATGTIYYDNGSKGYDATGKRVFKDCWRAEININGVRYRHRSKDRKDCEDWLKAVKQGKIRPTDNKADWWRMEQRKDETARIDELIMSAAEEANIVLEYRQTGDTTALFDYCVRALLPHMVYYCCHTLRMGRDHTLTASRQAVGLILTKIVAGRPVTNITFTCKRMLRTYQSRGDFWYYEKAPEQVKMMVNRIDFGPLAELWKVTKDKRI
mgnify:CR=1 FL=1